MSCLLEFCGISVATCYHQSLVKSILRCRAVCLAFRVVACVFQNHSHVNYISILILFHSVFLCIVYLYTFSISNMLSSNSADSHVFLWRESSFLCKMWSTWCSVVSICGMSLVRVLSKKADSITPQQSLICSSAVTFLYILWLYSLLLC